MLFEIRDSSNVFFILGFTSKDHIEFILENILMVAKRQCLMLEKYFDSNFMIILFCWVFILDGLMG